jgi:hypothetical protein
VEVLPGQYDIRNWVYRFRADINKQDGEIKESDLPRMKVTELFSLRKNIAKTLNTVPNPELLFTGRDRSILSQVSVLNPKAPLDTEE